MKITINCFFSLFWYGKKKKTQEKKNLAKKRVIVPYIFVPKRPENRMWLPTGGQLETVMYVFSPRHK